jgi:hypothetical protein
MAWTLDVLRKCSRLWVWLAGNPSRSLTMLVALAGLVAVVLAAGIAGFLMGDVEVV